MNTVDGGRRSMHATKFKGLNGDDMTILSEAAFFAVGTPAVGGVLYQRWHALVSAAGERSCVHAAPSAPHVRGSYAHLTPACLPPSPRTRTTRRLATHTCDHALSPWLRARPSSTGVFVALVLQLPSQVHRCVCVAAACCRSQRLSRYCQALGSRIQATLVRGVWGWYAPGSDVAGCWKVGGADSPAPVLATLRCRYSELCQRRL